MLIDRTVFNILHILFFVTAPFVIAGLIYGAMLVVNQEPPSRADASVQANAERIKASAQVYYSRVQFYKGVCQDVSIPRNFSCVETNEAYAAAGKLSNGKYYCVDSTGFSGITPWNVSPGEGPTCR